MTTNWFGLDDEPDEPKPWTLAEIYADLGTIYDVAEAMDITKFRIQEWVHRRERIKSPLPVRVIGGRNIYSIQEWKDWFAHWSKDRRPGTKWTDQAKPYGNGGLSTVIRKAADEPAD